MTLYISITNFKCYESYQLEIPLTGPVLVTGNTGKGKTTIIEAIVYALYGKVKRKNIIKYGKKQTSVVFYDSRYNIIVNRTKGRGTSLSVRQINTIDDLEDNNIEEMVGDKAQDIIDAIYGPYQHFMLSSCVIEGETNSFLFLPVKEMTTIVRSLVLDEDQITRIMMKIETHIKDLSSKIKTLKDQLAILEDDEIFDCKIRETTLLPTEDELNKEKKKLEKLKREQKEFERLEGKILIHSKNIENLKDQLDKIGSLSEAEDENDKLSVDETEIDSNEEIDDELDQIRKKISIVREKLNIYKTIDTLNIQIRSVKTKLRKVKERVDIYVGPDDREILPRTVVDYSSYPTVSADILVCPKCSSGLELRKKKLIAIRSINQNVRHILDRYKIKDGTDLSILIDLCDEQDELQTEYDKLRSKLEDIIVPNKTETELEDRLKELEGNLEDKKKQIQKREKRIKACLEKQKKIMEQQKKHAERKAKHEMLSNQIKTLKKEMKQLKAEQDGTCEVTSDDIDRLEQKIEKMKNMIKMKALLEKKKKITEELTQLEDEYESACKIKDQALVAQNEALSSVIETFNALLMHWLGIFFTEPIVASLESVATLKNGSTRNKLNFSISYDGNSSSKEDLSTGQLQRLSLAITLSFRQIIGGKLLLLDEVIYRVPNIMKDIILSNMPTDQPFILIGHDISHTYFDTVIDLDEEIMTRA